MKKQRIFVRLKKREFPTISKIISTNAETVKNPYYGVKKMPKGNLSNFEYSTSGIQNDTV